MISRSVLGRTRVPRSRFGRRIALGAIVSLALYAILGATAVSFAAAPEKIQICHRTASASNPYVVNNPDASGDLNGHLDHTGPIFPATGPDGKWGDIIPPIPGVIDNGYNWTTAGQAIYNNDCNMPEPADPSIHVDKSADPTTLDFPGGSVTYTYVVTNTGNVPLSDVTIDDDTCSPISGPSGDANTNDLLDLTETWTYECTTDVGSTTKNTVVVEATFGEDTVDDTDTETVTVGPEPDVPGINVEKSADPTTLGSGGGSVTYTYVVTNTGNVALSNVTIGDDKCSTITGPTGDADTIGLLEVDETWTYTCTMNVTATTTNTVVVEGTAGEDTVSDTDQATVTVGLELPATGTPSPSPSLPSTSTADGPGQGGSGTPLVLVLILLGAGAAGLVVLSPSSIRIRK